MLPCTPRDGSSCITTWSNCRSYCHGSETSVSQFGNTFRGSFPAKSHVPVVCILYTEPFLHFMRTFHSRQNKTRFRLHKREVFKFETIQTSFRFLLFYVDCFCDSFILTFVSFCPSLPWFHFIDFLPFLLLFFITALSFFCFFLYRFLLIVSTKM
jgi:hypothetical protein